MILALVFPAFMLGYVCASGLMRFVLTEYGWGTTLLSPLLTSLLWSFIIVYLFALIISLVYAVICRLNNKVDVPKEVDEHKEKNKKWIIGGLFVGLILIGTFSGINLMGTILTPASDPISPVGTWEGNGWDSWAILKIYEDKQVMFVTQFYEPAKLDHAFIRGLAGTDNADCYARIEVRNITVNVKHKRSVGDMAKHIGIIIILQGINLPAVFTADFHCRTGIFKRR